jgi:hypothetical protein
MITLFLIATLILFTVNLLILLTSVAQQYGDYPIQTFQVISLATLLIMITWNIYAIINV